jgi:polyhydroxyalkanoate synthesis regulator phasin
MESDPTSKRISPEGIAIDGAVDALTVEVCSGRLSKEEAQRVADELLRTEVGKKATREDNEAVAEFLRRI